MIARTHFFARLREDGEDKSPKQGGYAAFGGSGKTLPHQWLADHLGMMGRIGRITATHTCARAIQGPVLLPIRQEAFLARRLKISSLSSPSSLKGWQPNEMTIEKESGQGLVILPV